MKQQTAQLFVVLYQAGVMFVQVNKMDVDIAIP